MQNSVKEMGAVLPDLYIHRETIRAGIMCGKLIEARRLTAIDLGRFGRQLREGQGTFGSAAYEHCQFLSSLRFYPGFGWPGRSGRAFARLAADGHAAVMNFYDLLY